MTASDQDFQQRVRHLPYHGLGLSVDLYSPDLFELLDALSSGSTDETRSPYGYLELFKSAEPALTRVRRRYPRARLNYHAEGVWVTQPELRRGYPVDAEVAALVGHLRTLGSHWFTHECAAKEMAGYAFGSYLPPLYAPESAEITAENINWVLHTLDRQDWSPATQAPLFLLEMPPLTYVGCAAAAVPAFYRRVTELAPCGLVLDIGHLWTVYRYSGSWRRRSITDFGAEFLDAFPLQRVVQIHVAGLADHPAVNVPGAGEGHAANEPPWWIDAHGAPIPDLLLDMLAQVLEHPGLVHLKGLALEVDTKPIPEIVREFRTFRERFVTWERAPVCHASGSPQPGGPAVDIPVRSSSEARVKLERHYQIYARVLAGVEPAGPPGWPGAEANSRQLEAYHQYLRSELLEWGGALRDMFPETCRQLDGAGIRLDSFVEFWYRTPRAAEERYDFFLLKLARFLEFVTETLPETLALATKEAETLRAGYQAANQGVGLDRGEGQSMTVQR